MQTGDRAPDFHSELAEGHATPLRRLRRQPMTLVLWTSWAEPSLAELRRLGGDTIATFDDGHTARFVLDLVKGELTPA